MLSDDLLTSAPGISREAGLIMRAVSVGRSERTASEIERLCNGPLNWRYIETAASNNGAEAPLIAALDRFAGTFKNEPSFSILRRRYLDTAAQNLRLKEELHSLLRDFEAADIEVMPLKGPVLAVTLYPNLAHRTMADLDLLLAKSDVLRSKSVLLNRGFEPKRILNAAEEEKLLDTDSEYPFYAESRMIHVELHWDVLPSHLGSRSERAYFWDRRRKIEFDGETIWGLAAEDLLLYLCIHGGEKHRWASLKWIADVAHLLEREPNLDIGEVLTEARRLGTLRNARLGLYLARTLLDAPLPAALVADLMSDRRLAGLACLIRGMLFRPDRSMPGFKEWSAYWSDEAKARSASGRPSIGAPTRGLYIRSILTPEWNDRVFAVGSRIPLPLLSVIRIFRMLRLHGRDLVRRVS